MVDIKTPFTDWIGEAVGETVSKVIGETVIKAVSDAADGIDEWAKVSDPEPEPDVVRLLRAYAHQWGPGHTHFFNKAEGKTLCGRARAACPGEMGFGDEGDITCETCRRMLKRRVRA
jgi:hypothetical protein